MHGQRKVLEDKFHIGMCGEEFFNGRLRILAVRTLKIAEFDNCHGSLVRTFAGAFGTSIQQLPRRGVRLFTKRQRIANDHVGAVGGHEQLVEIRRLIFLRHRNAHFGHAERRRLNLHDFPRGSGIKTKSVAQKAIDHGFGRKDHIQRLGLVLGKCRNASEAEQESRAFQHQEPFVNCGFR